MDIMEFILAIAVFFVGVIAVISIALMIQEATQRRRCKHGQHAGTLDIDGTTLVCHTCGAEKKVGMIMGYEYTQDELVEFETYC